MSEIDCFKGISNKMTFNFHFFNREQFFKKKYSDLSATELVKLWHHLVELSEKSLVDWIHEGMSTPRSPKYRNYRYFPNPSKYTHPANVPEYAEWAAFRLGSEQRLCGFVIPAEHHGVSFGDDKYPLCSNTFYVVFYDHGHGFYVTKKK